MPYHYPGQLVLLPPNNPHSIGYMPEPSKRARRRWLPCFCGNELESACEYWGNWFRVESEGTCRFAARPD